MKETLDVRSRLLSWERLRISYNVIMLLVGVPVALSVYQDVHAIPEELRRGLLFSYSPACVAALCLVFGVAANVMYMLGPALEIYVATFTRLAFDRFHRLVLFALGLAFSLAVQGVALVNFKLLRFALLD